MNWSDVPFTPTSRTLRQFALLWVAFFGALAGYQGLVRDQQELAWIFGLLAYVVGPAGLVFPSLMRPIFVGWMILVFPIGWLVSHLLLGVLFYGLFTPLGLLFRLLGRDVLSLRRGEAKETYWVPKPVVTDTRRYFRQF